jgi:N-acetylmuramic acid 6-phosphate etherase
MSYEQTLESFLEVCEQFKLGDLVTESPHPVTKNLSSEVKEDPLTGVNTLKEVDRLALDKLCSKIPSLKPLHDDIRNTILEGGDIYLCGCGATGRLSLAIEFIWRKEVSEELKDRVKGFMAGGDCALIASIEKFEDFPEFGKRQLNELGFSENDLLVAITEGGETPFVIGAAIEAKKVSKRAPYFVYCNPDGILSKAADRSKEVIEDTGIKKINLEVGPMAITGSTRMQATTVQMFAVGSALLNFGNEFSRVDSEIKLFTDYFNALDISSLSTFVKIESDVYKRSEYIFYEADENFGISILTDTTERSPTFSLAPFENELETENLDPSLCYLVFPFKQNNGDAWDTLLARKPRAFHWPEISDKTRLERLYGFNISSSVIEKRNRYLGSPSHSFKIAHDKDKFIFELGETKEAFATGGLSFLSKHMLLKLLLNNLSTNIMGRLSRYEGNVMTWVRPSNYKLIDRTIRYVDLLTKRKDRSFEYNHIAETVFELIPKTSPTESLVLKTTEHLLKS